MTTETPDDWHLRHCADLTPTFFDRPKRQGRSDADTARLNLARWEPCRKVCDSCPMTTHCEIITAETDAMFGPHLFAAGRSPEERRAAKRLKECRICGADVAPPRTVLCSPECAKVSHNAQQQRHVNGDRFGGMKCGTHSKYCNGCRCDACRSAHTVHMRRYRSGATKTDPLPRPRQDAA